MSTIASGAGLAGAGLFGYSLSLNPQGTNASRSSTKGESQSAIIGPVFYGAGLVAAKEIPRQVEMNREIGDRRQEAATEARDLAREATIEQAQTSQQEALAEKAASAGVATPPQTGDELSQVQGQGQGQDQDQGQVQVQGQGQGQGQDQGQVQVQDLGQLLGQSQGQAPVPAPAQVQDQGQAPVQGQDQGQPLGQGQGQGQVQVVGQGQGQGQAEPAVPTTSGADLQFGSGLDVAALSVESGAGQSEPSEVKEAASRHIDVVA